MVGQLRSGRTDSVCDSETSAVYSPNGLVHLDRRLPGGIQPQVEVVHVARKHAHTGGVSQIRYEGIDVADVSITVCCQNGAGYAWVRVFAGICQIDSRRAFGLLMLRRWDHDGRSNTREVDVRNISDWKANRGVQTYEANIPFWSVPGLLSGLSSLSFPRAIFISFRR
jgi:hypothetical protein